MVDTKENIYIDMIRNKKFLKYFILYSSIFIFSFIISAIIGWKFTSLPDGTIYVLKTYTSLKYGNLDMIGILVNNFLISIIFLYYFYTAKEDRFKRYIGMLYFLKLGLIGGLIFSKAAVIYNIIIASSMIVPHGIIEIPTIIYSFSVGWILSELKEERQSKVTREFIYVCVIIFILLSISAYIETYITLEILEKLLSYYHY